MRQPSRNLLEDFTGRVLGHLGDVNVLAIDVVPRSVDKEGDVVGEVEACGDEGQADEEEEERVCEKSVC